MQQQSNAGLIAGIVAVTVLIFAGLAWAIVKAPAGTTPVGGGSVSFNDANDPFKGPTDAKVVVRLYEDFECPACRMADGAVQYAIKTYSDRVKFVWKDFPLVSIHPNARPAANAARCAEEQGKFWEYHDKLYVAQSEWSAMGNPANTFASYAEQLGLNKDTFASCYGSRKYDSKVSAGMGEGLTNKVDRTPTFFVNDTRYFAMSPAEWDAAITSALAAVSATVPSSMVPVATTTTP